MRTAPLRRATALHTTPEDRESQKGFAAAAACYLLWGVVPIYWKQLGSIDSIEVIAHRSLWSLVAVALAMAATSGFAELRALLANARKATASLVAALLLAGNWLIYVYGVNTGRVSECSLGYFLVPLVNVATGRLVLHESIRRMQWIAIGIAAIGVAWMVAKAGGTPWLAFGLAGTWGAYGAIRKQSRVGAMTGLAAETLLTAPLAIGYIAWNESQGIGAFVHGAAATRAWLASTGIVTAIPLVLFAYGAVRIRLATLGLLQYIAPSVQLVVGVWLYGEPFDSARAIGFACIWSGLAFYAVDNLRTLRWKGSR